jgi:hypothetical protein
VIMIIFYLVLLLIEMLFFGYWDLNGLFLLLGDSNYNLEFVTET